MDYDDMDKTIRFSGSAGKTSGALVTIFDGSMEPKTIRLDAFRKNFIYFGRGSENDIVLTSQIVSSEHGRFVFDGNTWVIED